MTWTRFEFNGGPFDNEAGVENVVVAAPAVAAREWWEHQYGMDPERTTDDATAWTVTEKPDPDIFARFILGMVEFGGIGTARERPAELSDMQDSDEARVVMPDEMAEWGHELDADLQTPERPWVPDHAQRPDHAGRGPPEFVPNPFDDEEDEDERPGRGRGR